MSESGSKDCPKVTLNASTIRVGLVGPSWTGTAPDLTKEIVATVTPKSKVDKVSFSITNSTRAKQEEKSRQVVGDSVKITFTITGLTATPDGSPTGDADFEAKCSGKVLAKCAVLVVIPKTQTHSVGGSTIANDASLLVPPLVGTNLNTEVTAIVTITIKDQFGVLLDKIYDGANRVEEKFTLITDGTGPFIMPAALKVWGFINIPAGDTLKSGVKLDETGYDVDQAVGTPLTPVEIAGWKAGTYSYKGAGDNVMEILSTSTPTVFPNGWTAVQEIRVLGWSVTPNYTRYPKVTGGPYGPPAPYVCTDT